MIALDESFVFVHVPKTAGNSISTCLAPHCSDVLHSGAPFQDGRERFSVRNDRYPGLHKHSTLAEYAQAMGEAFLDVVSLCCVRNPWDRALSMYFSPSTVYQRANRPSPHPDPGGWDREEFLKMLDGYIPTHKYVALPDQPDPWQGVDLVIRFERLEDDLARFWKILDLPGHPSLARLNASRHEHRARYYDAEMIAAVEAIESPLVKAFGYEP